LTTSIGVANNSLRLSSFSTLAFGISDYLLKPFSREELINRIQSVVARANGLGGEQVIAQSPAADQPIDSESRRYRRYRTIKSAKIDYGAGIPCRVLNISHAGAGLRLVDAPEKLPRSFMLVFDSGESQLCRVSWRDGDRSCIRWDIVADSAGDLTELASAMDRWALAGDGASVSFPATDVVRIDSCV